MSTTIVEALMNAEFNLHNFGLHEHPLGSIAVNQLHNARVLLEKGYDPNDEIQDLLDEYGAVELIPDKEK